MASCFDRIVQTATYRVFVVVLMRIQQFQEAGHGVADGNGIALVHVATQREVLADGIAEGAFAHLTQPFRQIIDDQAIAIGQEFGTHLGIRPAPTTTGFFVTCA